MQSIINFEFNELHFGALMVYFTTKSSKTKTKKAVLKNNKLTVRSFRESYKNFSQHIDSYRKLIKKYLSINKKFYVIGAALMLPLKCLELSGEVLDRVPCLGDGLSSDRFINPLDHEINPPLCYLR